MVEQELQTVEEVKEEVKEIPKKEGSENPQLVFDLYDVSEIEVKDPGLKNVINVEYKLVIKSRGRNTQMYGKANVNIIERLVNNLSVPGHRGKKHKIITKWATGKYNKNMRAVLDAFEIIAKKTGENPVQVLVTAIEKGAPRDEVTMIQYGGARYPQAVDCAPLRRISLALRNIVHGAYDKSFRSKKSIASALADELIETAKEGNSAAVAKRGELERQADSAR
jgi:small subunit ribosomal protein S7